jgi:hypothetical protein
LADSNSTHCYETRLGRGFELFAFVHCEIASFISCLSRHFTRKTRVITNWSCKFYKKEIYCQRNILAELSRGSIWNNTTKVDVILAQPRRQDGDEIAC